MPRAGLSTGRLVERASELVDEVGCDGLTLALLAESVGVRVPSLYKHISSLAALRAEVGAAAAEDLARRLGAASVGVAGADAMDALADAYRAYAHEHPGRYAALQRAEPDPASPLHRPAGEVVAVFSAVLAGYGITGEDRIDATRGVRSALHGFVSLEAIGGFGLPRDVDRSFRRLVRGLDRALRDWQEDAAAQDADPAA